MNQPQNVWLVWGVDPTRFMLQHRARRLDQLRCGMDVIYIYT